MLYALTRPLPQPQRNEIANRIEQAYQQVHPDTLRHDPGLVYACDAEPSYNYYCVYCAEGIVRLYGRDSPQRYFRHRENSCIDNPGLNDTDTRTLASAHCQNSSF